MHLIKPRRLAPGDTVAVVAPSAYMVDEEAYQRGVARLENLGYRVREGRNIRLRTGYMAGMDLERAEDLVEMFADVQVRAIIALLGGSTANRLLDKIDYRVISANAKVFSGMSDITNLHVAFLAKASMSSLYGIDATFGFGGEEASPAIDYSIDLFQRVTTNPKPIGAVPAFGQAEVWREGEADGRLFGGYLPALALIPGTMYWPAIENVIFFWEAANCEVHEIDRLLHSLRLSGFFERVKGMLVGQLPNCEEREFSDCGVSVRDVVVELADTYKFPVLADMDFGHVDQNLPLPYGLRARIDTERSVFELLEGYVL